MMQEVVRALETGGLAEVGLVAFFVAFVLVVAYALTLSKKKREAAKHLPFDEAEELRSTPSSLPRTGSGGPRA